MDIVDERLFATVASFIDDESGTPVDTMDDNCTAAVHTAQTCGGDGGSDSLWGLLTEVQGIDPDELLPVVGDAGGVIFGELFGDGVALGWDLASTTVAKEEEAELDDLELDDLASSEPDELENACSVKCTPAAARCDPHALVICDVVSPRPCCARCAPTRLGCCFPADHRDRDFLESYSWKRVIAVKTGKVRRPHRAGSHDVTAARGVNGGRPCEWRRP